MLVGHATAEDWLGIWPFFNAIVAAGETFAFPLDLTVETGRAGWMEPPPGCTVVAASAEAILGSAKMGPNRPGPGRRSGAAVCTVLLRSG